MANVFMVDAAKCNGCYNCQLACKDEHAGNDWRPYAAAQPEIGQFWLRLTDHPEGTIPKVRIHYIAELCGHCRNAACMDVCEADAIYRRDDGFIIIEPDKCTGCKKCMEACPYEAVFYNEAENICQKCTGCAHLLDNVEGVTEPRCVEACPTGALAFGDEDDSDVSDFLCGASVIKPETASFPRVYYRNIPGKFIGGTVYDPSEKEVITHAKVRATVYGKTYHTVTDNYGDFWFNDLPVGKFKVVVEADGYEFKVFDEVRTDESKNLGDIPMERR